LSSSVNSDVMEMSGKDAKMGPEWERDIAAYLKKK